MRYLWILILCSTGFTQCLGDMNDDGIKDILDIANLVNDILDGDDVCEETPPDDGECNCPSPDFESGTDQCAFMTNESCIEDCGFDPDDIDIYEGWIPVCTDCLANDDCDDAVEAYEECFGCLDNCDDEDAPPGCIDYCTQLYCP